MSDAISSAADQLCACCGKWRLCKMYVLQNGEAAWVCKPCRKGEPE